jgi:hypothetical protein
MHLTNEELTQKLLRTRLHFSTTHKEPQHKHNSRHMSKPSSKPAPATLDDLERLVASGGAGLKALVELGSREGGAARHARRRAWTVVLDRGELAVSERTGAPEAVKVAAWLKEQYLEYMDDLVEWTCGGDEAAERVAAMRTLMHFASTRALVSSGEEMDETCAKFDEALLTKLFFALATKAFADQAGAAALPLDVTMRAFREEYLNVHVDVQLHFARAIKAVIKSLAPKRSKKPFSHVTLFRFVCWIPNPEIYPEPIMFVENDDDVRTKFTRRGLLFKAFQGAWLEFLRLADMPLDVYRAALTRLPKIIPLLNQPLLLGDFLTDAFSAAQGQDAISYDELQDQIPFLALSSLFVLVRDYGMDYPKIYDRLYELIRPSLFYSADREPFCKLLEACLKSPHIPAYLVASFCKRLARVAILSPPSAALFALPMIYNLLRRHPSCSFLIHRAKLRSEEDDKKLATMAGDDEQALREKILIASRRLAKGLSAAKPQRGEGLADPFVFEEADPNKSKSAESCLWEVEALKHHYDPTVAALAKSVFAHDLAKDRVTKPELPVEDFLNTYQDLYVQESKQKRDDETTERKRRRVEAPLNVKKPGPDALDQFVMFSS